MSAEHEFINVVLSGAVTLSSAGPAYSPRQINTDLIVALNNKDKQVSVTFTPNHQDKFVSREYSANPEQAPQFEIKTWVINNPEVAKRLQNYQNQDGTKGIKIEDFISKIGESDGTNLSQEELDIALLLRDDPTVIEAGKKTAEYMNQIEAAYNGGGVEGQIAWGTLVVGTETKYVLAPIIYTKNNEGNKNAAMYPIIDNGIDQLVVVSYVDRIGSTATYSTFHPKSGDVLLPSYVNANNVPTSAAVEVVKSKDGYAFRYFDLEFGSQNAATIPTPGINNSGVERVVNVEIPNETPLEALIRNANENPISYPDITNGAYIFNATDKFKVINDKSLAKDGKVRIQITKENGDVQTFVADNEASMIENGDKNPKRKPGTYSSGNKEAFYIGQFTYGWALEQGQSNILVKDPKGKEYELPVYYIIMLTPDSNGKFTPQAYIRPAEGTSVMNEVGVFEGGSESNFKTMPIDGIGSLFTWDNSNIPILRLSIGNPGTYDGLMKYLSNYYKDCGPKCETVAIITNSFKNREKMTINDQIPVKGFFGQISTEMKPKV